MMTSAQLRQSFLDFFREKQHTIVAPSSLLPDSPNLLFTNAGMNQFVPIFLGERRADVSKWAGAVPSADTRAADTQKCIRAGGKHNDLEDVGIDTYHHTFFEMLGNWSFGDYFKKEAIEWAWELVVVRWKFPPARLYATIYQPGPGDPAERDEEAWGFWAEKFRAAGLDPAVHIVNGNKKDNFWMMGETGPCGPCSELHVDLTPAGDTQGRLVNQGSPECIEIWNLVFIQFNANPDGTYSPLPARHVDTGMGFERVASIIQGTKDFTDFANAKISNYETDVFRPLFDELEKMSGKHYASTLPPPNAQGAVVPTNEQEAIDIAFRVIADHIRTLSFAVADGIQPGNSDRNYVLRRILRRAVRYGRTLSFHQPFFYKLAGVLAEHMGDVFPELRVRLQFIKDTLRREEETFNKTLDKGIALFEAEAARTEARGAHAPSRVVSGALAGNPGSAAYSRRHLPRFERPWGKYMATFSTREKRVLSPAERDLVLESVLYADQHRQYLLYAACVMPDHVHLLFEPQVKETDARGDSVFFSLSEILQGIKSSTAHRINAAASRKGEAVWEKESFDRLIRSEADLLEKYDYILRNPWTGKVAGQGEGYPWVWTPGEASAEAPKPTREGACAPQQTPAAPEITGDFAFKLYDTYGFPLDLTELMARERGLTVDTAGFEQHMDAQRARARAAQKKTVIELSEIETKEPTHFLGYDHDHIGADVAEVLNFKGQPAVILNNTVLYAEMGGQVGDSGELTGSGKLWRVANTHKSGGAFLHFLEEGDDVPAVGDHVTAQFDRPRRAAIQRHHTVTHLLHWALHEVVSREATQKGSFVGPDKLTFDFNGAALTPAQVRDIERLVNERILENAPVSWTEVFYADVRGRADIMQAFGDKYGVQVRVVQIGGAPGALAGYSMELCGGTHTRHTGEVGLFRIVSEGAVAAGVRRIEAVAGLTAHEQAVADSERLKQLAATLSTPLGELEKRVASLLAQQKESERQLESLRKKQAAATAAQLAQKAQPLAGVPAIVQKIDGASGDDLQQIADALKAAAFQGVALLAGTAGGQAALLASVSSEFTGKVQAGKLIQALAPIVGGKGGGRPDSARGAGKEPARIDEALAKGRALIAGA